MQCICIVLAHVQLYWMIWGYILMPYRLCGSFAHYNNLHMYTVLSLRVLLLMI
jgi:hypothetical protein